MKEIKMRTFGKTLGTRVQGEEAFKLIEEEEIKKNPEKQINLNFEGVNVVTNSFADETRGKNVDIYGFKEFKKKFLFSNTNKNVKLIIKKVIVEYLNK